jgi:hypothetical protein
MRLRVYATAQIVRGRVGPTSGIVPDLDTGVDERVMTLNELFANPELNVEVMRRLGAGQASISISGEEAVRTAEF